MKPTVIGIIIIGVLVGAIAILSVSHSQQTQINELQNAVDLQNAEEYCEAYYTVELGYEGLQGLKDCYMNAYYEYGTEDEIAYWENAMYLLEEEEKVTEKGLFVELEQRKLDNCREKWIGQLSEYNNCVDDVERLYDWLLR